MRKFLNMFLVVFLLLFSSVKIVTAASKCDYNEQAELNNAVANIKVSYEEAEEVITGTNAIDAGLGQEPVSYYFKVQIYNMPENVYLKVTNDVNSEVKYLTYKDNQSGVVEFDWKELDKVANFTISVLSNEKSSCPNEEYRIIYITLPRYNSYSNSARCIDNESYYLCQKYTADSEEVDYDTFIEKITAFENDKDNKEENENGENKTNNAIIDFIKDNKVVIGIISTIIVIGGVVAIVIVIKRRRSRLI